MPDQGPRAGSTIGRGPWRAAALMEGRQAPDALLAEHGFSVLVAVARAGASTGSCSTPAPAPTASCENMRRLDIDPGSDRGVVCSHGHFDHTTGIDGLIRRSGRRTCRC